MQGLSRDDDEFQVYKLKFEVETTQVTSTKQISLGCPDSRYHDCHNHQPADVLSNTLSWHELRAECACLS